MPGRTRPGHRGSFEWNPQIKQEFPDCDDIIRRLIVSHQKRSRFLSRASIFWFRLFGAVEVTLGVVLPLLFLYPQTQNNTALQATVSVLISMAAALSSFWGWRDSWGIFRVQNLLLAETLSDWELNLLEIINSNATEKKMDALNKTRETVAALFAILNQEHEASFATVQSPNDIVTAINSRTQQQNRQPDTNGQAEPTP
ncbi:hypothetical protein [Streptomyces sp. NBC_00557]|uniref:hypothetical protein n=1 Tax=Streptomyces sp. NBC_00557 TaxID=2975776 RepID=UPI002E7FCCD7|nr:hypothetical protein [Streptomyces sp. NBC_00557]WUC36326.1 hypothetical protein OG956_19950 [Streptomyces sp. NBC_00557]